jgi:hypothetical protein
MAEHWACADSCYATIKVDLNSPRPVSNRTNQCKWIAVYNEDDLLDMQREVGHHVIEDSFSAICDALSILQLNDLAVIIGHLCVATCFASVSISINYIIQIQL